jgi:mRNA interferase RelE/StbE
MYKVEFTPQGLKDITKLDKLISGRIVKKIEWLSQSLDIVTPQPLKGKFQGIYKLVVGDWRVLYSADFIKKVITVHTIGHRSNIYK